MQGSTYLRPVIQILFRLRLNVGRCIFVIYRFFSGRLGFPISTTNGAGGTVACLKNQLKWFNAHTAEDDRNALALAGTNGRWWRSRRLDVDTARTPVGAELIRVDGVAEELKERHHAGALTHGQCRLGGQRGDCAG